MSAAEMRRQSIVFGPQPPEVDDSRHSSGPGGSGKPLRSKPIGAFEIDSLVHRVDEPVADIHADTRLGKRGRIGGIPDHDANA